MPNRRVTIPEATKRAVFAEAGYRCAVPTCRGLLVLDLHHPVEVSEEAATRRATCSRSARPANAMYTRGHITPDAMSVHKGALEALSRAYDQTAIDRLLLFTKVAGNTVGVSGDGVLQYGDLIASNLVTGAG
jgi:hypothetical protein